MNNHEMTDQTKYISSMYKKLHAEKSSKIKIMEEGAKFFNPEDNILSGSQGIGNYGEDGKHTRYLLDTNALEGFKDYLLNIFGVTYSTENKWFSINHKLADGSDKIEGKTDLMKVLEERSTILHKCLENTNYYQQIINFDEDIAGNGHALMVIDKGRDGNFADCYTKNPINVYFLQNHKYEIIEIYWTMHYLLHEIKQYFPSALDFMTVKQISKQYGGENTVILSVYLPFVEPYVSKDELEKHSGSKFIQKFYIVASNFMEDINNKSAFNSGVYGSLYELKETNYFRAKTVFAARDRQTRSHPYGDGQYRDLLPRARLLNRFQENMIRISDFQAHPPAIASPDLFQKVGGEGLKAGDIFTVPSENNMENEKKLENHLQLLQVTGDLKTLLEMYNLQVGQLANVLPTQSNIYKTARQSIDEISSRMAQEEKKLGGIRANYLKEGTKMHLRRFYQLAEEDGSFKEHPLPQGIKSKDLVFNVTLSNAHNQKRLNGVLTSVAALGQIASIDPSIVDNFDGDTAAKIVCAANNSFDLIKSEEEVIETRKQQAQQAQRQQSLEEQKVIGDSLSGSAAIASLMSGGGGQG